MKDEIGTVTLKDGAGNTTGDIAVSISITDDTPEASISGTSGAITAGGEYTGGEWYWLKSSGAMAESETINIGGRRSRFASGGAWQGYVN